MSDIDELESDLYAIDGVVAASVSGSPEMAEIGLLIRPEVDADELITRVRGVVSSSDRGFVDVSLRIVPIGAPDVTTVLDVLPTAGRPAVARPPRPVLKQLTVRQQGVELSAEVVLSAADGDHTGTAVGNRGALSRLATVAAATVAALATAGPGTRGIALQSAQVVSAGDAHVAMVVLLELGEEQDTHLVGAVTVRGDDQADAVVRAVLDATNRTLGRPRGR
jgi:hypothetical protein